MNTHSVECRSVLADGSILTVSATRRPRANRADVKCSAAGAPALAERMQHVVRLARLTEPRFDSREQVVIAIDRAPARHERDWELAVVLADRMVRGLYVPTAPIDAATPSVATASTNTATLNNAAAPTAAAATSTNAAASVLANGWSTQWQLGRVEGHDVTDAPPGALLGGPGGLTHLGALSGQPDAAGAVSSARAWFPLHSGGINDSLCWVEVSVYPLAQAGGEEEDSIAAPGLDVAEQLAVRQALAGARLFDARGVGRWRTVVRFGQSRFQGNSYELALVLADRLARGREFVARGRIIASGCSSAWQAGRVDSVEGLAPKCALIVAQAVAGDRVLLPKAWEAEAAPLCTAALREKGASVAFVERIGII